MYVIALEATEIAGIAIHLLRIVQVAALTKIPAKYFDYAVVFFFDLAIKLSENIKINKHAIKLINGKQPFYRPIYTLSLMELKTLKTYIKTHLKTGFIQPSKSLTGTSILFNKKPNSSFHLCINY